MLTEKGLSLVAALHAAPFLRQIRHGVGSWLC